MRFLTIAFVFGFAALCSALPADLPLPLLSKVNVTAVNASLISEKTEGVVEAAENNVKDILGDAAEAAEDVVDAAEDSVKDILGDAAEADEDVVDAAEDGVEDSLGDAAKAVKKSAELADEEDEADEDSDDEKEDLKESVDTVAASNKTSSGVIRIPRLGIRTHIGVVIPRFRV